MFIFYFFSIKGGGWVENSINFSFFETIPKSTDEYLNGSKIKSHVDRNLSPGDVSGTGSCSSYGRGVLDPVGSGLADDYREQVSPSLAYNKLGRVGPCCLTAMGVEKGNWFEKQIWPLSLLLHTHNGIMGSRCGSLLLCLQISMSPWSPN